MLEEVPEDRRQELLREQAIGEYRGMNFIERTIDNEIAQLKDQLTQDEDEREQS